MQKIAFKLKIFFEAIYPLLIYQAITAVVTMVACFLILFDSGSLYLDTQEAIAELQISNIVILVSVIGAVISLLILIFINLIRKDNILNIKGSKRPEFVNSNYIFFVILLCLALALFANGLINIPFVAKLVSSDEAFVNSSSYLSDYSNVLTLCFVIFIAPIIEEYVFRRMCYGVLRKYVNVFVALVFSAVYFGIFHGNFVQGMYATILGFGLAYLYEVGNNVLLTIFAHICSNILAILISLLYQNNILYLGTDLGIIIYTFAVFVICILLIAYIYKYRLILKGDINDEIT